MRSLAAIALGLSAILLTGCAGQTSRNSPIVIFPDMDKQGKYKPQSESPIFADGRASRRPVEGTVAVGMLKEDDVLYTGVVNNQWVGKNPLAIDMELLKTGQRRFNTYCTPCHDRTGHGRGLVGVRAIWIPTNLHEDRVKQFNDGEIFNVISNGRRSMPPYKYQVTAADRWAIVAYVRALQRAGAGTVEDVPQELRTELR
jgi:mono/diheme cytochrome c family protein